MINMTPIEKVQARSDALKTLGVPQSATPEEIHAAWRRHAFDLHPDRRKGTEEAFARARWAYELLHDAATEPASRSGSVRSNPVRPRSQTVRRRPELREHMSALSSKATMACHRALAVQSGGHTPQNEGAQDHVPARLCRRGREMTFVVQAPMARGANRVAVPAAALVDPRRVMPRIIRFKSPQAGAGTIEVPTPLLPDLFPGAHRVRIRFNGQQSPAEPR